MSILAHTRLANLAAALDEAGADAFFAWHPVTMGYLHNFHEGAYERFLALGFHRDGRVAMVCPSLSATQACRAGIKDIRSWRDGEDPLRLFADLADEWNLRTGIIALDDEMPAHMVLGMQSVLPAALFKAGGETINALMRVKSPEEIEYLRRAGEIADLAFADVVQRIQPGHTEVEVERMLRTSMAEHGGEPTFSIVAAGANGAEPHHLSDGTVLKTGDVVIMDFGCSYRGYLSDITRTISMGPASPEAKHVYGVVYAAFCAARNAIREGVACGDIDSAARTIIEEAGFGEYFMHRTGHGIGLRGHEEPYILAGSKLPLAAGHCFSVEPGIYLPDRFGVRIENIVSATVDGHVSMNADPSATLLEI